MKDSITVIDQRVVTIGGFPIDMFLGSDRTVYFGAISVRLAAQADSDWPENAIDQLMGIAMGVEQEHVLIDFGIPVHDSLSRNTLLTHDEFRTCLIDLAQNLPTPLQKIQSSNLLESQIQQRLAQRFGCKREVRCPSGRVDLLSKDMLIEVKSARQWKSAVGQVLAYSTHFPSRQNIIYLFDVPENFDIDMVRNACSMFGIEVMTEDS